jgi:two-component system response regulator RegA
MTHPVFLIVDDDALLRVLLQHIITTAYPYAPVHSAASVADALKDLHTVTPTIVLTDYHLLDGTGLDVLRAVRMARPTVPVVVISGDVSIADTVLQAGANAFLSKPFDAVEIWTVVAQLCTDRSGAPPNAPSTEPANGAGEDMTLLMAA